MNRVPKVTVTLIIRSYASGVPHNRLFVTVTRFVRERC
jgi:hypothetical protein